MDDIFTRILDLTSYLSSPLLHLLEDLYSGIFNGHLESLVALCSVEYSSSASFHERRSAFGECSSSPKHNVAIYRGIQRRALYVKEPSCVNTSTETVTETGQTHGGMPLVFGGLTLPLYGLRVFQRLALASLRCFLGYCRFTIDQVKCTISRVNKGVRGSSDDIGWLQRTPEMPPVTDGTTRFLEVLQDVRNGNHVLPDSFVYLLIPGLFSNHGPLYFVATKRFFSKMGLTCHIAKIHSEASVEHNAWVLKQYIEELYWGSGKRVMLLGHSKGGVDAAAALSKYWKDLQGKVAGLALVQSPYGGTPIASDALREGQVADKKARRVIELLISRLIKVVTSFGHPAIICVQHATASTLEKSGTGFCFHSDSFSSAFCPAEQTLDAFRLAVNDLLSNLYKLLMSAALKMLQQLEGDFQALEDLTYEKRKDFVLNHKLPEEIPLISFHSEASIAPSVLATLTQIAHAELPWFPLPTLCGVPSDDYVQPSRKVPVMIPISATMAVTALHLKLRYGEKSDGLVTCRDAEVPGSVVIRPDKKLDHAWIAYSSWKKNPSEPDCCEMCEAILTILVELGEQKRQTRKLINENRNSKNYTNTRV